MHGEVHWHLSFCRVVVTIRPVTLLRSIQIDAHLKTVVRIRNPVSSSTIPIPRSPLWIYNLLGNCGNMEEYARSFPIKLNSNYAPSESEIVQIRELLKEQLDEITEIDEYISSAFDGRLQKQERIRGHIKDLQSLLSPTRRLSTKILQRIFFFCLPTKRNAVMSSNEAPLLLGRVSRTWRDISLATPELWASIHIPVLYRQHPPLTDIESEVLSNHRNEAVKRWLDRSGMCPLSISVVEVRFGAGDDLPNDPGASLFEVLAQFSKRWCTIELNFSPPRTFRCSSRFQSKHPPTNRLRILTVLVLRYFLPHVSRLFVYLICQEAS